VLQRRYERQEQERLEREQKSSREPALDKPVAKRDTREAPKQTRGEKTDSAIEWLNRVQRATENQDRTPGHEQGRGGRPDTGRGGRTR